MAVTFPTLASLAVSQLYDKHQTLARGSEDDRRKLTRMIAEQIRHDIGARWGTKASSSGAPQSKDAIAHDNGDGSMDIWDWQNGSSRLPQVKAGSEADYKNVTGQHFIAVQPVNHLGVPDPGPIDPNPGTPPPPGVDLSGILKRLETVEVNVRALNASSDKAAERLKAQDAAIKELQARKIPTKGSAMVFGYTVPVTLE